MDDVSDDLNILLSALDLDLKGSFDGEQGGFATEGVQSGKQEEDLLTKSCGVVLDQVRILEQALMPKRPQQKLEWDADRIVDIAVAHGMVRPAAALCGGGSNSNDQPGR